jgi:hypothetical protein
MGGYIGPVEKLERREGVSLDLKGKRQLRGKTSLERRGPQPPGQHGAARRRAPSVYGQQLREAQKLKIASGIREKQMRRLVDRARRNRETTSGEALAREAAEDIGLISAWLVADHQALNRQSAAGAGALGDRDARLRAAGDRTLRATMMDFDRRADNPREGR